MTCFSWPKNVLSLVLKYAVPWALERLTRLLTNKVLKLHSKLNKKKDCPKRLARLRKANEDLKRTLKLREACHPVGKPGTQSFHEGC